MCLRAGDSIVVQRQTDAAAAPPAANEYRDSDVSVRHLIRQL